MEELGASNESLWSILLGPGPLLDRWAQTFTALCSHITCYDNGGASILQPLYLGVPHIFQSTSSRAKSIQGSAGAAKPVLN